MGVLPPRRGHKCEPPWVASRSPTGRRRLWSCPPSAPFFEGRPSLLFAALDGLLVSLVGPTHRLLQAQPQLPNQAAEVCRVVEDPELSLRITSATLAHVHTSPRKPYAGAPRSRSSGPLARCSSLRRGAAPGGGLCLKPSTPSSLARFIHWLTGPSVTPRASAICVCFQPRSFSSKARKRLPSRQSLAWLENVLSIVEFIIPRL
jgi:hypothetical protein